MTLPVYLVEDDERTRVALTDLLTLDGQIKVVGFTGNQVDAIAWMRSKNKHWSVVIIDLLLEKGSGLSVLAACKERKADQHAVVLTNYATAEMRRRCLDLGADAVYDKADGLAGLLEQCKRWAHAATPAPGSVVRQFTRR